MMSIEELQHRIKQLFLKLDKDWFFDQQLEKYQAVKSNFLQTDINYNENSKLKKLFKKILIQGTVLIDKVTILETNGNKSEIDFYNTETSKIELSDEERKFFQN